ncbi:hypothetical protein LTR66_011110 [Elasticomyces elasticus]|nr:hypothetical protein LTR66_011110 [Elasticomyces elasticus]
MGEAYLSSGIRDSDLNARFDCAADFGFPSPPDHSSLLISPQLETPRPTQYQPAGSYIRQFEFSNAADAVSPQAGVAKMQQIMTPEQELQRPLGLDAIVGASVAPTDFPLPTPPISKVGPSLRLPSFDSLGIAAPYSNRFTQADQCAPPGIAGALPSQCIDLPSACGPTSHVSCPLEIDDYGSPHAFARSPGTVRAKVTRPPLQRYVSTLTPPHESDTIDWSSIARVTTAAMDSPSTDAGAALSGPEVSLDTVEATSRLSMYDEVAVPESWLSSTLEVMASVLQKADRSSNPIKVLSHALPCPSTEGHAFPLVIDAIHSNTPRSPTVWINVFHAVPGRFNLANLPTSPPSTPGPPVGGDDYFTSKIFDSAVPVSDYQEDLKTLPRSPRPVVPPGSINVSIVERFIPPTSTNEFSEMFKLSGPSILVDRMVELAPSSALIFVYPTSAGATTFMRDYLGPILDPLLRAMVVVNGLSADLSSSLGKMAAVDSLPDHATMRSRIARLCRDLSKSSASLEKLHRGRATFELVHEATEKVVLDRKVWANEWWIKQEKPRVRETVTKYFRLARRLPAESEIMPTHLIQEILEGVANRPYQAAAPTSGIEVGVFVIKRSS